MDAATQPRANTDNRPKQGARIRARCPRVGARQGNPEPSSEGRETQASIAHE
jgi:hypothetical protein